MPWKSRLVETPWKSQSYDGAVGLYLAFLATGAACFFFMLYALSKPAVNSNPGLAAYSAPPGTRLLPLPRKSDAPELVEVPREALTPLNALARAEPSESQPKAKQRPSVRKRREVRREQDQRYAPQWNDGYREWRNDSRAWNGGFRPWF